jgi:chromate transporter
MPSERSPTRLAELAKLFLKLGSFAFGGPAAHIAMMEDEVVRRHRWMARDEFLDLLGATHLLPGPNSTELAIYIGHRRGGCAGLLVAGICFILPAALLAGLLAWGYVRYGNLPKVGGLFYGIKPVMLAVVLQALWGLGRIALKNKTLALLGLGAVAVLILGAHELGVLLGTGILAALRRHTSRGNHTGGGTLPALPAFGVPVFSAGTVLPAASATAPGLWGLFLFFLKVGSVLFGSGYVLLAFLRADLVDRWGWLTEGQLLDAIAVGQITPGPVFTTATFIGYLLAGWPGASLATLGIFLPAFCFVALSGPLIRKLRGSSTAGAFLDGVNVASLALMAVVTVQLGSAAVIDTTTLLLAALSALLLFRFKTNACWLVLAGAAAGFLKVQFGM